MRGGLRLVRHWLSPNQRAELDDSYRIYRGTTSNVFEIDDAGRPKVCWCFMPLGDLVAGDVMLAQKIALETNENAALAVAKRFLPRDRARPGDKPVLTTRSQQRSH
jgi:hypothetical protein